MIFVNLNEDSSNQIVSLYKKTTSPIIIEEQLDTSLDGGTLNYLITEQNDKGLNEALAGYLINVDCEKFNFVGMDSRALVRRGGRANATVTRSSNRVTNNRVNQYYYRHIAQGEISVSNREVEIVSVSGNVSGSNPKAMYSAGKITWIADWTDTTLYKDTYVVTITYSYLSNSKGIYSHQVALTEPSKLLQGVMIDGFGVTQPEAYDKRKSLLDVVNRLLAVYSFDDQNFTLTEDDMTGEKTIEFDGQRFTLTGDENVVNTLLSVKSPEFKWNTQTSLWECLLQVGAVIDAIPRLIADDNGNFTVITFDFVNSNVGEIDSLDDSATNAFGENVDESLYNTALSSVVENLRENE